MEQSKAQLELDWQQRVGDVERQQNQKYQELIRQLSRAREEVSGRLSDSLTTNDTLSSVLLVCRHWLSVVNCSKQSHSSPE